MLLLMIAAVPRFLRASEGQDLIEYGLLAALISIFAFGAVQVLGNTIHDIFWVNIAQNF